MKRSALAMMAAIPALLASVSGAPAAQTAARPSPASFTAALSPHSDHTSPYVFVIIGRVGVPDGVDKEQACHGNVSFRAHVFGKVVPATLHINPLCKYGVRFHFTDKPTSKRITFRLQFLGNDVLGPSKARILHATAG